MAPNNALATRGSLSIGSVTTSTTSPASQSSSSILQNGVVANRGHGSTKTKNEIDNEIQEFISETTNLSLYCEVRCFFTVWTFLTRLPGPTFADHHPGYLMKGMVYFPIVGTFIGYWIATFYCFANITLTIPPLIASTIALASSFWLTGCFHEDGLGDTADGFGGGWSRSQILKIMTDTRLGTYGCVVLIIYIVAKIQLYTLLGSNTEKVATTITNAIIVSQSLSRLVAVYMIKTNSYIDESDGPKTSYYHFMVSAKNLVSYGRLEVALLYCFGLVVALYESYVFAGVLISIVFICGHFAGRYSTYILGGIMGDFLGATICVVELVLLTCILLQEKILLACILLQEKILTLVETTIPAIVSQFETFIQTTPPEEIWNIIATKPKEEIWNIIYATAQPYWQNEQFQSFAQFLVMIVLCKVWSDNVGHPDVLVRDIAIQNTEKDTSEINISLKIADRDIKVPTKSANKQMVNKKVEPVAHEFQKSVLHEAKRSIVQDVKRSIVQDAKKMIVQEPKKSIPTFEAILKNPKSTFIQRYNTVREYIDALAKPVGSLGVLEEWAAKIAAVQRTMKPTFEKRTPPSSTTYTTIGCCIFAADHGMAADVIHGGESCSAYPQTVTRSILHGFEQGRSGAYVLAQANNTHLYVIDVGVTGTTLSIRRPNTKGSWFVMEESPYKLVGGTKNICLEPAMTIDQCTKCLQAGRDTVKRLKETYKVCVVVLGEIGIGNTTTSSLLLAALLQSIGDTNYNDENDLVSSVCDGGATIDRTVDDAVVTMKIDIVQRALQLHSSTSTLTDPTEILATYGGAEIAAIVGAILYAAEQEMLVVIDGFIVTVAAAVASSIEPLTTQFMLFASRSTERGYSVALDLILKNATRVPNSSDLLQSSIVQSKPALDMNLRMGEATAGLLTVPLLRNSVDILCNMATIQDILSSSPEAAYPDSAEAMFGSDKKVEL